MALTSFLYSIISIESFNILLVPAFIGIKQFHQWIYANAELLPLVPAIIIVGGLIILTLIYVSWRKYKGEIEKLKRKNDESVD